MEAFQEAFCVRCLQTECTRSVAGTSKFDQRVHTWVERLFTETPRLDPHDPRYGTLAGQNFLTIDVGRTPEVHSDWVDPLTMRASDPPAVQASPPPTTPTEAAPKAEPAPALLDPGRVPRHMILANAPDQSGKMLPGAPTAATPQRDVWSTPEKPEGTVVQRGATIKLGKAGGSGV